MKEIQFTAEQLAIINHDTNKHATVLAVAGSGKTQTMVYRIKHLIDSGVPHNSIRAVMYNRTANVDFQKKLSDLGLSAVKSSTFHALGNSILTWAAKEQLTHTRILTEEPLKIVKEAIRQLKEEREIARDAIIDPDEVLEAISTWKSMLTMPNDAKHLVQPFFESIYQRFESLRHRDRVLTFDDLITDAVHLFEQNSIVNERVSNRLEHIIVDEFQDVNLARLQLVKVLAGSTAKVMVVGDDDQCIYEWQGARSSFIKRGFRTLFTTYPHSEYKLTSSFRFGPAIAQVAANVIGHNSDRVEKELVSKDLRTRSFVALYSKGSTGGERQLPKILLSLFDKGIKPIDIAILVRKNSQSFNTQLLLMNNKIPFIADGMNGFFSGFAVHVILNYIDIAASLDKPLTRSLSDQLLEVANRPNRFVKRSAFDAYLSRCVSHKMTVGEALYDDHALREAGIIAQGANHLMQLERFLRGVMRSDDQGERVTAGDLVYALLENLDIKSIFSAFQGDGKADEEVERIKSIGELLKSANISTESARQYIRSLDTTLGREESDCVRILTIFRAKGLEWNYVFLPGLVEGQCPDLRAVVNVCVNKSKPDQTLSPTETLESERRLFYVGVTRARKGVFMFSDASPGRQVSRFIPEAALEDTVSCITSIHKILDGTGDPEQLVYDISRGAAQDARLRSGILKMLRRLTAEDWVKEAVLSTINNATISVNATESASFSYPHAYQDTPKIVRKDADKTIGLPF